MPFKNVFTATFDIGIESEKDPNYTKAEYDAFQAILRRKLRDAVYDAIGESKHQIAFVNSDIRDIIRDGKYK